MSLFWEVNIAEGVKMLKRKGSWCFWAKWGICLDTCCICQTWEEVPVSGVNGNRFNIWRVQDRIKRLNEHYYIGSSCKERGREISLRWYVDWSIRSNTGKRRRSILRLDYFFWYLILKKWFWEKETPCLSWRWRKDCNDGHRNCNFISCSRECKSLRVRQFIWAWEFTLS